MDFWSFQDCPFKSSEVFILCTKKDFTALTNIILAVCRNGVGVGVCVCKEEGQLFFLFLKTSVPFYKEILL